MVKRYYFLLFLIVSSSIHSQSNLNFNKIEIPEISTNETKSLFIDINGFNWISTDEGLNRFDGIKIQYSDQIHLITKQYPITIKVSFSSK